MELTLNIVWACVTVCMFWLWLRVPPRRGTDRRVQLVALAMIVVILLPAISMTDDLMAAQNPAEVDTYLRRDHDWLSPHSIFPAAIALVTPLFAGLHVETDAVNIPREPIAHARFCPALSSIDNRPPPAA